MNKGLKVFVNLALLFALCIPAFSQPNSKSAETFLMDSFDSDGEQNYYVEGESYSWNWTVNASRFVAEGYPKFGYFNGIPNSLKVFQKGDSEPKVLGVNVSYNRKGDNWFEIIPTKDGKTFEIPFVGNVDHLDFWVWGANYLYYLEVMVRDANGRVHVFPACNMRFNGWKNVIVKLPGWLTQHSRLRSGPKNLSFVGFRVRSDAAEYVDDFTIYFDNLKYMSNSLSYIFDGYELQTQDFSEAEVGTNASDVNKNSGSASSTSSAEAK